MEPSQVRLMPRAEDPYRWKVLPEKQHLFEKNLSDHSTGAYKDLWNGVNATFEAVPVESATAMKPANTQDVMISLNVRNVLLASGLC